MNYGLPWSDQFIDQLSDKEARDAYVAEQVRIRIAQLIKVLREHPDRNWTQTELGNRADKKQNVISRLENPDGPQPSVQTLLEIAAAFDLPLWIDMPQWDEWLEVTKNFPGSNTKRDGFNPWRLKNKSRQLSNQKRTGSFGNFVPKAERGSTTPPPANDFRKLSVVA